METQTLYKFVEIKGGKRTEKFRTPDIKRALKFHKWYVNRYKEGLLFEVTETNPSPSGEGRIS